MSQQVKLGWSGGVNKSVDPTAIRDDQLANGRNCWPTVEGLLGKRHAVSNIDVVKSNTGGFSSPFCVQMWQPDPVTGFDFIMQTKTGAFPSELGVNMLVALQAGVPIPGLPTYNDRVFVMDTGTGMAGTTSMACGINYNGRFIAVYGAEGVINFSNVAGTWKWSRGLFTWTADAAAGRPNAQSQNTAVTPKVVGVYRGRAVYANFGPGMGHWLVMADRPQSNPLHTNVTDAPNYAIVGNDVLSATGRHVELDAIIGQDILYVGEVSLNSIDQPLQRAMMVLTDRSCVLCTGELSETTDTGTTYGNYLGDFQAAKVNFDCGVAGPRAVTRGPNGTFWFNGEDVYALYDGQPRPRVIGTNIRPALKATPYALRKYWHMAYADGCVFASIATQDSTDPVSPVVNHWRLDLRPQGDGDAVVSPMGPGDARWWGPQDYSKLPAMSDVGFGLQGSLSLTMLVKRNQDGQDIVHGSYTGSADSLGTTYMMLVSFNEVFNGRDVPFRELVSANAWGGADYTAFMDARRPTVGARDGYQYVCVSQALNFKAQTANFTVGQVLTGSTSGATGTIRGQVDAGATGTLVLQTITGNFLDNELITDALGGSARADGTLAPGTTGVMEPTWPGAAGVVLDGTVYWQEASVVPYIRMPNYLGGVESGHISMEPDFKALSLGTMMQDKLWQRADISAYVSVKQLLWLEAIVNGGLYKQQMGPCIIGDFTLGRVPAMNDLGDLTLDVSAVAMEFQARQLRPANSAGRLPFTEVSPGIVRGRIIQPGLREGSYFVVDDTNDYLVLVEFEASSYLFRDITQVQIEHGEYTLPALLQAMATALGAVPDSFYTDFSGGGVHTWSYADTLGVVRPYMVSMVLTPDSGRAGDVGYGFACLPSFAASVVYQGTTLELGKCGRLLSMLGYNTNAEQLVNLPGIADVNLIPEDASSVLLRDPAVIHAVQAIPVKHSAIIQVNELSGKFALKRGMPFGTIARDS